MSKQFATALDLPHMAAPANPASGRSLLYVKSDGKVYAKDSAGVETLIGPTAGGGSPAWGDITGKPATFPPDEHDTAHDDRFSLLAHTHAAHADSDHDDRFSLLAHTHASLPLGMLAHTQVTAAQTSISSLVDIAGSSSGPVSVGAGRSIKITGKIQVLQNSAIGTADLVLREGSTELQLARQLMAVSDRTTLMCVVVLSPSTGSHTYKLSARTSGGNITSEANANNPAFILVEDIG